MFFFFFFLFGFVLFFCFVLFLFFVLFFYMNHTLEIFNRRSTSYTSAECKVNFDFLPIRTCIKYQNCLNFIILLQKNDIFKQYLSEPFRDK